MDFNNFSFFSYKYGVVYMILQDKMNASLNKLTTVSRRSPSVFYFRLFLDKNVSF